MKQAIKFKHVFLLSFPRALKITDCPLAAEGKYKCASHDDSTECELTVYPRNKVLKELEDVSVAETEMATFECQMSDAEANVVWYHKGDRILEGIHDEK